MTDQELEQVEKLVVVLKNEPRLMDEKWQSMAFGCFDPAEVLFF